MQLLIWRGWSQVSTKIRVHYSDFVSDKYNVKASPIDLFVYFSRQNLLMLVQLFSSAVFGVDAQQITLEVNIDKGIGYHLVGLPDNAIKESNYRIAAALQKQLRNWLSFLKIILSNLRGPIS